MLNTLMILHINEREFDFNSNNLLKSWNIVNEAIGRSNKNCNVSNEMIINNKLISDKQCIANDFGIHYSTIGSNDDIHSLVIKVPFLHPLT